MYDVAGRVEDLHVMRNLLSSRLCKAKDAMKQQYDKRHLSCTYCIDDWIMLCIKHIDTGRPAKKLDDKQIGSFQVSTCVGHQAYTLQLPPQWHQIHPIYHVSLLEPWKGTNTLYERPGSVNDNNDYAMEKVLAHKDMRNNQKYLVKWTGWPKEDATWESEEHLSNSAALDEYIKQTSKRSKTT